MKNNLTELVFILDRSGSMHGLESDTIGGFNSVIEEQKKLDGQVFVSTVLFSDTYKLLHQRIALSEIRSMTTNDYRTQGLTALLDAIGKTIQMVESTIDLTEENDKPRKVLFVIITDGLENASREYRYGQINAMIEAKKRVGWEFLFLGANIDAVATAKRFGINQDRAADYVADSVGIKHQYESVNYAIHNLRVNECIGKEWKNNLEKDIKRKRK